MKLISCHVTDSVVDDLQKVAREQDTTFSNIVRQALSEYSMTVYSEDGYPTLIRTYLAIRGVSRSAFFAKRLSPERATFGHLLRSLRQDGFTLMRLKNLTENEAAALVHAFFVPRCEPGELEGQHDPPHTHSL